MAYLDNDGLLYFWQQIKTKFAAVEQLPSTVEDALADHPEWTTTVQDGSITASKLATDLARDRERLLYRLDNLLTNALPEGDTATATDAARTPMAALALYGKSTQDGTPTPSAPVAIESVEGNLLPPGTGATNNGITYTVGDDGVVTANGTCTVVSIFRIAENITLPAGTYRLSANNATSNSVPHLYCKYGSTYYRESQGPLTIDEQTTFEFFALQLPSGTYTDQKLYPQVMRSSALYPYVPYDHAGLWARGRNLLPRVASETKNGITFTTNDDGSTTLSGTASGAPDHYFLGTVIQYEPLPAGSYVLTGCTAGSASTYQLFFVVRHTDGTTTVYTQATRPVMVSIADGEGVRVFIRVTNGVTVSGTVYQQLELGDTAHAYQPYASTVTPIDLDGHELRSLPDGTRDEVTVDADGHAVLVQRVGAATFAGSSDESWKYSSSSAYSDPTNGKYCYYADVNINGIAKGSQLFTKSLCSAFSLVTQTEFQSSKTIGTYTFSSYANYPRFTVMSALATVDAFESWLSSTPVTLLYPLATPVTIDLGYVAAVPLVGPDLTAQSVPTAPFSLTYERDLNATLARLESAIADVATS